MQESEKINHHPMNIPGGIPMVMMLVSIIVMFVSPSVIDLYFTENDEINDEEETWRLEYEFHYEIEIVINESHEYKIKVPVPLITSVYSSKYLQPSNITREIKVVSSNLTWEIESKNVNSYICINANDSIHIIGHREFRFENKTSTYSHIAQNWFFSELSTSKFRDNDYYIQLNTTSPEWLKLNFSAYSHKGDSHGGSHREWGISDYYIDPNQTDHSIPLFQFSYIT